MRLVSFAFFAIAASAQQPIPASIPKAEKCSNSSTCPKAPVFQGSKPTAPAGSIAEAAAVARCEPSAGQGQAPDALGPRGTPALGNNCKESNRAGARALLQTFFSHASDHALIELNGGERELLRGFA